MYLLVLILGVGCINDPTSFVFFMSLACASLYSLSQENNDILYLIWAGMKKANCRNI